MINKVIDFKKSKEKLINKKFPNVSPISNNVKDTINLESNKAFEKFQTIFFEYQEMILRNKEKYIGKKLFIEYGERSGINQVPFHVKNVTLCQ